MSLHDALADKAYEKGHRAERFKAAAQRNANAFWFYLVIAGAVWWFASWAWALIPAALAVWCAWQSVSATMISTRLELIEKMSGSRPQVEFNRNGRRSTLKSMLSFMWSTLVFAVMLLIAGCFLYAVPTAFVKNGVVVAAVSVLAAFGAFAFAIRFLPAIGKGIGALRRTVRSAPRS